MRNSTPKGVLLPHLNAQKDEIKSSLPKKSKETNTIQDIGPTIETYLTTTPFIHKEFSLSQMSFDVKIPERVLSNYFNKELNKPLLKPLLILNKP